MNPDPWADCLNRIAQAWPIDRWSGVGVLVGCSGGGDSVLLTRALASLGRSVDRRAGSASGFLVLAHFNHARRGIESDRDEAFVRDMAATLGLEIRVGRPETVDPLTSGEADLRDRRYHFFAHAAAETGCRYVALGHTCDDNVETVLHHLLRGTGPAGLAGIPGQRDLGSDVVIVRPMLRLSRVRVREALVAIDQRWREDSSNAQTEYSRNWIRHHLLPMIRQRYPHADDAIDRLSHSMRDWKVMIDQAAAQWIDRSMSFGVDRVRIDAAAQATTPAVSSAVLIRSMQQVWTRMGWRRGAISGEQWSRLEAVVRGDGGRAIDLPDGITASRDPDGGVTIRLHAR